MPLLSMLFNFYYVNIIGSSGKIYGSAEPEGPGSAGHDAVAEPLCEGQPSFHRK